MDIVRVCLFALGTVAVLLIIKEARKEYSVYIIIAAALILISIALDGIKEVFGYVSMLTDALGGYEGGKGTAAILIKSISLGAATAFTCEICRDAGEDSIASKVSLCGKTAILALTLPVIKELCDLALELMGI